MQRLDRYLCYLGITVLIAYLVFLVGCNKSEKFTKIVETSLPKTVTIYVAEPVMVSPGVTRTRTIIGAGVYISQYGHILTCAHLFTEMSNSAVITVENYNGFTLPGEVLYLQEKQDLALVKTEQENTSFTRLADTRDLVVGQEVFAIGAPLGETFSVSNGIISALNRDGFHYNALQTNTAINPGNSGGPLFNLQGELVGINSFIESPLTNTPVFTGLGFSVEAAQCLEFLAKFRGLPDSPSFNMPPYRRDMKQDSIVTDAQEKLHKVLKPYKLPYLKDK